MISVIVAAGGEVKIGPTSSKDTGINNPLANTDVWFVSIGIFFRQRVREIRVQKDGATILNDKEPALAEPPEAATVRLQDAMDVFEENVVLLESGFHRG